MTKNQVKKAETRIQQEIFTWHWNNCPKERGLLFAVNNNSHSEVKGAMNKSVGVVSGVSDMIYLNPRTKSPQLLELKTPNGSQSKAQKEWQFQVDNNGFEYHIVRSLEDFKKATGLT